MCKTFHKTFIYRRKKQKEIQAEWLNLMSPFYRHMHKLNQSDASSLHFHIACWLHAWQIPPTVHLVGRIKMWDKESKVSQQIRLHKLHATSLSCMRLWSLWLLLSQLPCSANRVFMKSRCLLLKAKACKKLVLLCFHSKLRMVMLSTLKSLPPLSVELSIYTYYISQIGNIL